MLLVTDGTLKKREFVLAGDATATVRILENSEGEQIDHAGPGTPATVIGFDRVPHVGIAVDTFVSRVELEESARQKRTGSYRRDQA